MKLNETTLGITVSLEDSQRRLKLHIPSDREIAEVIKARSEQRLPSFGEANSMTSEQIKRFYCIRLLELMLEIYRVNESLDFQRAAHAGGREKAWFKKDAHGSQYTVQQNDLALPLQFNGDGTVYYGVGSLTLCEKPNVGTLEIIDNSCEYAFNELRGYAFNELIEQLCDGQPDLPEDLYAGKNISVVLTKELLQKAMKETMEESNQKLNQYGEKQNEGASRKKSSSSKQKKHDTIVIARKAYTASRHSDSQSQIATLLNNRIVALEEKKGEYLEELKKEESSWCCLFFWARPERRRALIDLKNYKLDCLKKLQNKLVDVNYDLALVNSILDSIISEDEDKSSRLFERYSWQSFGSSSNEQNDSNTAKLFRKIRDIASSTSSVVSGQASVNFGR